MEFLYLIFNCTILHSACMSGNFELVKYLISLKEITIKSKEIFDFYLMKFLLYLYL